MHHLIGLLVFLACLLGIVLLAGIAWLSLERPALAVALVFALAVGLVGAVWLKNRTGGK